MLCVAGKDVASIMVPLEEGQELEKLLKKKYVVYIQVTVGDLKSMIPDDPDNPENPPDISRTSVLFVSISFIVLLIISLAWLIFYYIQRFRYAHAKERLTVSYVFRLFRSRNFPWIRL